MSPKDSPEVPLGLGGGHGAASCSIHSSWETRKK